MIKRIYFGMSLMLFGILIAVSTLASGSDVFLAICWGLGIWGLLNVISGYFTKGDDGNGNDKADETDKNAEN